VSGSDRTFLFVYLTASVVLNIVTVGLLLGHI